MPHHSLLFTSVRLLLIILGPSPSLSHRTLRRVVGESVTFGCDCQDSYNVMHYWYKQVLGQKPVKISSFNKYNAVIHFEDSFGDRKRFTLQTSNHGNNLIITDLRMSDAASYFCMSSNLHDIVFLGSVTLDVVTTPEDSGYKRGSLALGCAFDHGVFGAQNGGHWFKPSSEPVTGVLYSSRDEPDTGGPANSCLYHLPSHADNVTHEWSGCAVASCGRALFSRDFSPKDNASRSVLAYVLGVVLAIASMISLSLVWSIHRLMKKSRPTERTENEESIHYAALKHHSSKRPRSQVDVSVTECVYSGVRL